MGEDLLGVGRVVVVCDGNSHFLPVLRHLEFLRGLRLLVLLVIVIVIILVLGLLLMVGPTEIVIFLRATSKLLLGLVVVGLTVILLIIIGSLLVIIVVIDPTTLMWLIVGIEVHARVAVHA